MPLSGGGAAAAQTIGVQQTTPVTFTSSVNITAVSEATADTIVTSGAFTADGTSTYLVEFWAPDVIAQTAAGRNVTFCLYQDGSSIGKLGTVQTPAAATTVFPCYYTRLLVPSQGSRTFSIRAFVNAGTGVVDGGAGGNGNQMPGYIRITRAA